LIGRSDDKLKSLSQRLGVNQYIALDFVDERSINRCLNRIKQNMSHIDILINAAGIGIYKPLSEITLSDWRQSFAVNVTAPANRNRLLRCGS